MFIIINNLSFPGHYSPPSPVRCAVALRTLHRLYGCRQTLRALTARDNYADLEHKEVWQSLLFADGLFLVYQVYTSNGGELLREYLSQVVTIVIIAFLVWRVETLEELESEESE